MAYLDPPSHKADIERAYRKAERARVAPSRLAIALKRLRMIHDPSLAAALVGTGTALATIPIFSSLAGAQDLPGYLFFMGWLIVLVAILVAWHALRTWVDAGSQIDPANPAALGNVLENIRTDDRLDRGRLEAVVEKWLRQSGIGSLTSRQVRVLQDAIDEVYELLRQQLQHDENHRLLEAHDAMISRMRARHAAGRLTSSLPQPDSTVPEGGAGRQRL